MLVFVVWWLNGPENKTRKIQYSSASTFSFRCVSSLRIANAQLELSGERFAFVINIDLAQRRIMKAGEWLRSPVDEIIQLYFSLH